MSVSWIKKLLAVKLVALFGAGFFWLNVAKVGGGLTLASCAVATLTGCSENEVSSVLGSACTIEQDEVEGIKFICADGSEYFWSNRQEASPNCHVEETDVGARIDCPDGSSVDITHGKNGEDGEDGASCSAHEVDEGVVLQCGEEDYTLVRHGRDGQDGSDGQDGEDAPVSAYTITDMIDPCGKETAHDEVLLVFANGDILAHYSAGKKQHFSTISPGNYITTDGTNCVFQVSADGQVTWDE